MLGIVIVSHSAKLAEGAAELVRTLAADVPVAFAGGLEDGSFGTSFDKISAAIESVYSEEGVIIFCDMGSALLTTEMVLEAMPDKKLHMAESPVIEGALVAAMASIAGEGMEGTLTQLADPAAFAKR